MIAAGCAAPRAPTEVVRISTPVPCRIEDPGMPAITDAAALRAMSGYARYLTIARERLALLVYASSLQAAAKACEFQ